MSEWMEWTNDIVIEFLECYQAEPIIWNPKHRDHKDKKKVNDAWARITQYLGIPVAELKKKKETLMATFRGHLRKKKASIKFGAGAADIYEPVWFAYNVMENFLLPVYTMGEPLAALTFKTDHPVASTEDIRILDDEIKAETSSASSEICDTQSLLTSTLPALTRQTNHRRIKRPEIHSTTNRMKEAFNTLSSVLKKRSEEDECDLFARLLAKKIRRFPENERELLMYEIDGMIINRTRRLSNPVLNDTSQSSSTNSYSTPSPPV